MCGPLRDDGVSYGDYLVQLTYLIFLKMSDEHAKPPLQAPDRRSERLWLGGTLGKIFKGATNKISNAAILYRIV